MDHTCDGNPVVYVMRSDLETATGLVNLITTAADALGREVRPPTDHSDLAVARQLLELLGLAEPPASR